MYFNLLQQQKLRTKLSQLQDWHSASYHDTQNSVVGESVKLSKYQKKP